ncbi:polysaccharide lyase 8 family protein [Chitinophagaceae bacterium LWZ2-11]
MKNNMSFLAKYFFVACLLLSNTGFGQSSFDVIIKNINDDLHNPDRSVAGLDKAAGKDFQTLQSDGSWPDLNYGNTEISLWAPATHLSRLQGLAVAYTTVGSSYKNAPSVYTAIIKALRYWYQKDPQSKNWWHNQINAPQQLGEILIVMRLGKQLVPSTLEDSLAQRMKRGDPYKQTGANKLDVAIHYLYRAALTKNAGLMDIAVNQAFQPISFTDEEGLQYDYSYLQHGRQLQISSYGAVFISGEYKVAKYVQGTGYALKGEQLNMLSNYYINTYLKTIRGGYIDFNVEGRGVSRENILNKTKEKERLQQARLIDPAKADEFYAAIARTSGLQSPDYLIKPLHTFFWSSDYTLHVRPQYSFNVRMVSTRTKRTEAGNKENLLGKFMPDGATDIQRSGSEYYNIMPVWEWDKIPGTTAKDYAQDQPTIVQWGENGSTDFTGGVSDSVYGTSVYSMNYNDVTAKKSWFFFDKEVVCLGAGIQSSATENITTTINQCWLKGKVTVSAANNKPISLSNQTTTAYSKPSWVLHDSIGYFFLDTSNIQISTQTQSGDWFHINNSFSKKVVSGGVFKMWLNHGVQPSKATYAYVVVPGVASEKEMNTQQINQIKVLKNNEDLQAVKHIGLDMLQVVFYKPGTLADGAFSITVDKPCVVLLKNISANNCTIHVADPSQQNHEIDISLKLPKQNAVKQLKCKLPEKPYAGGTVRML